MEIKEMEPIHIEQMEERQEAASCKTSISVKGGYNQNGPYVEGGVTLTIGG